MAKRSFPIAPLLLILTMVVFLSACAHKKKAPVEQPTGSFLEDIYATPNTSTDLEMFGKAMPSYLQYIDGAITHASTEAALCKVSGAYYGYAFCFAEDTDKEEASRLYLKGRDITLTELRRYGFFDNAITYNKSIDEFRKSLDDSFDKKRFQTIYWAAMNWAGWISVNLDNPEALADIPRVQAMLEFLNAFDDSYSNGVIHAVLGTLYACQPQTDGGNLEKAREEFDKAFSCSFNSVLAFHVMHAQYYACRVPDRELFRKSLETVLKAPANYREDMNFLNEVSKRKARFLLDNTEQYFKEPAVKAGAEPAAEPQGEAETQPQGEPETQPQGEPETQPQQERAAE